MTNRFDWKTGLSIGCLTEEKLQRCARNGIQCVEIASFAEDGDWNRASRWAEKAGVELWSFHLPFRWKDPIANPAARFDAEWQATLKQDTEWIQKAGSCGIKVAVIHPSLEPIPDAEREGQLQASMEHLAVLAGVAKENGLILAVEDLPRTCLGNCADEMVRIMESCAALRVCFDVNHLLKEDHESFVRKVGKYIVTTHISDYDFEDEKHWMPLQGRIPWKKLLAALEQADYNGPFLYEINNVEENFEKVFPNHQQLNQL